MRLIFHVDMDAFFASVEQRDNPALRGRPVIIGGGLKRGVVAAASYEVRKFGVRSAMPMAKALRQCPEAVVIPPNIEKYRAVSADIMEVFADYSPLVEPLSFDEAFLDMTGSEAIFGPPVETAQAIKRDVFDVTDGLTCSVGIGANKFMAKLASPMQKPDGVSFIRPGTELDLLGPMPVRKMWGVGEKTAQKLYSQKILTFEDLRQADAHRLAHLLGKSRAYKLKQLAAGQDDRPVVADRERKSIGSETTLMVDIQGREQVEKFLREQCEEVAKALRKRDVRARSARVKLRYSENFQLRTRQGALPRACDDARTLFETTRHLLNSLDLDRPIRLVGAAGFDLAKPEDSVQLGLFAPRPSAAPKTDVAKEATLEKTMDAIRDKFGDKIGRASVEKGPAQSLFGEHLGNSSGQKPGE
ncbi:DNA polymerase IV [Bradymonas sediminis]|uniref:DNA polymerase IV n=1 Tax=Bradymonas sediminis TaxID=1548548 RepID=A0A2Z4FHD8_9DELT|nr:DNA polymerase IV [Bradymonas sediminis]AWV88138.1 DNA polymerase IV [Bradymonas sediminis]TDP77261.1 DNA polymerase-4 [Bradymonas sediminis]